MKKILVLTLVMLLAATLLLTSCSGGGDDKLVVAMELAYPPFETKDESGEPIGVSVDLAKAIGEHMGVEVEIVNTAWDGLIPSLQTGKADMIISSMTITEAREEEVDFSVPYANSLLAILTNKEAGIESIEDLNSPDKTVAVKNGSTGHLFAMANLTNAKITVLADESACVTEVSQGKADGFLYDQLTIYRNNAANPDTTEAVFIPFQDTEYWGVAVKEGNEELLEEINECIESYDFDILTDKYLSEEKTAFDELGFKWFFDLS